MLIKCKDIAEKELDKLTEDIDKLKEEGCPPHIRIIRVDGDDASSVYVNKKIDKCSERNIDSSVKLLPNDVDLFGVTKAIDEANHDDDVTAVMVQLPLPNHLKKYETVILDRIFPIKDADCLTTYNIGRLFNEFYDIAPCTPQGVMDILNHCDIDLQGKKVLVINRSKLVGKPLMQLLLNKNAQVNVAHSKCVNLTEDMLDADIIITATGRANFIDKKILDEMNYCNMHCGGRTTFIVDVGVTRNEEGRLCGDVIRDDNYINSLDYVKVTASPGGAGLTTVANLLKNTVTLTKLQSSLK